MPHNRYYIDAPLEGTLVLEASEWHHLAHVSRGKVGQQVELINGKGILALATLEEIDKKKGILSIQKILQTQSAGPSITLCLALSRMNHLEWAVEKATELGATSIWLFPGMLSEKDSLSANQLARLQSLILAATKQSGRLYLPEIKWLCSIKEIQTDAAIYLCDTAADAPYLWEKTIAFPLLFLIGPESGFHQKEVTFFKTTLKAESVRLHPNILRTETAPLVTLSLIQPYTNYQKWDN